MDEEKCLNDELKEKIENELKPYIGAELNLDNLETLYKLVDIHKDLENENYWKEKIKMRYYDEGEYGRRGMSNRGRYNRGRYSEGDDMIDDMREYYGRYSESRNSYNGREDSMKSLDYMLKSVHQFIKMLEEDAQSEDEMRLIKSYTRKISEM